MVGTRIARARKRAHVKQVELAAAMGDGISRSAISMIETGAMDPSFARATEAAQALDVSLDYLAGLTDDPKPANRRALSSDRDVAAGSGAAPPDTPGARPVAVRELAAAAGGGALDLDETIRGWIYFRREWLDRQAIDPRAADVIKVRGESMEPTLPDGCSILLDRRRRSLRSGRIFVVRTDEGVVVKRSERGAGGGWLLISDHPTWPSRPWPTDAEVIGQVRWMAHTL